MVISLPDFARHISRKNAGCQYRCQRMEVTAPFVTSQHANFLNFAFYLRLSERCSKLFSFPGIWLTVKRPEIIITS